LSSIARSPSRPIVNRVPDGTVMYSPANSTVMSLLAASAAASSRGGTVS
jgi:hypothetical protein